MFGCLTSTIGQVSAVTDQMSVQVSGATTGDLDDDEGGGLVGAILFYMAQPE